MIDGDESPASMSERLGPGTTLTLGVGVGFALLGAIAGVVLAAHKHVIDCPDGTFVEDGQDPNCYAYPDAAQGLSIMFAYLALLLLIVLAGRILLAVTPPPKRVTVVKAASANTSEAVVTAEPGADAD